MGGLSDTQVVGKPTKTIRHRDLNEQSHSSHGVRSQSTKTKLPHQRRCVGIECTLRSIVAHRDAKVRPHAPVRERLLERSKPDPLLLSTFGRVVNVHSIPENMDLAIGKHLPLGKESRMRALEAVGQEASKNKPAEDREAAHECEEPEPARLTAHSAHVQDAVCEDFGGSLTELVAEVEDHDALRSLGPSVPRRKSPETSGNEA
jgi:hypothetical protein